MIGGALIFILPETAVRQALRRLILLYDNSRECLSVKLWKNRLISTKNQRNRAHIFSREKGKCQKQAKNKHFCDISAIKRETGLI